MRTEVQRQSEERAVRAEGKLAALLEWLEERRDDVVDGDQVLDVIETLFEADRDVKIDARKDAYALVERDLAELAGSVVLEIRFSKKEHRWWLWGKNHVHEGAGSLLDAVEALAKEVDG